MNEKQTLAISQKTFQSKVIAALKSEGFDVAPKKFYHSYLKKYKFTAKTVFDIGVYKGTPELYKTFPDSKIVLLDPLEETKVYYEDFNKQFNMDFIQCAIGSKKGQTCIHIPKNRLGSTSILERTEIYNPKEEINTRSVEVKTLDDIIQERKYISPYGVKIDTEGYELEVLKGMSNSIKDVDFIIAEVSIKKRFVDSYEFSDIVSFLARFDFALLDVLNSYQYSPRYLDCLFARKKSFRFNLNLKDYPQ